MKNYFVLICLSLASLIFGQIEPPPVQQTVEPPLMVRKAIPPDTIVIVSDTLSVKKPSDDALTVNKIAEMAIFPGCETFEGNKIKLVKCFHSKLSEKIALYLDTDFPETSEPKRNVKASINFIVNTEGEITDIVVKRGDKVFYESALKAAKEVVSYLEANNLLIQPAKKHDGSKADLLFSMPIILENLDYLDTDWIVYFYNKGLTSSEIAEKLQYKSKTRFSEPEIIDFISKLK